MSANKSLPSPSLRIWSAYIAIGTVNAVYLLLNTAAPEGTESAGVNLHDFTTGHSLTGALSPSISLALVRARVILVREEDAAPHQNSVTCPTILPNRLFLIPSTTTILLFTFTGQDKPLTAHWYLANLVDIAVPKPDRERLSAGVNDKNEEEQRSSYMSLPVMNGNSGRGTLFFEA